MTLTPGPVRSHPPSAAGRRRRVAGAEALLVALLAASSLVVAALLVHDRLAVAVANRSFALLCLALTGLGLLRVVLRGPQRRWARRLRDFSECALIMLLMAVLGGLASYAAAARTRGFYDPLLERSDRLLHFDWLALYRIVQQHPWLQHGGAAAYGSIYVTPLVLIGWLAWHGQRAQAHRFLMTFWLGAVLTLALFPLLPARGALEFLWHGPVTYMPATGLAQGMIITALRGHALNAIDLGALQGVVCAPSFHTVCAVIYIATAGPCRGLRWIVVPVNLAMLLATPVEGTHYLTDMLLGVAVAGVALTVVRMAGGGSKLLPQSVT